MNRSAPAILRSYLLRMMFLPTVLVLLLAGGCQPPYGDSGLGKTGCRRCHQVKLDPNHDFRCSLCHRGVPGGWLKREAHKGLVLHPAGPGYARIFCKRCHEKAQSSAARSIHYTLNREIGIVWQAFFPEDTPPSILEIHGEENPQDERSLIRDLLARRCLRCHVYYQGDSYRGTRHGTGCAACHMDPGTSGHEFYKQPREQNCLSCHYANFIGWDYEGRFEKDYPEDFRAPLLRGKHIKRPFGVEWISMGPDLHKKAGMTCLDCHDKGPFHPGKNQQGPGKNLCLNCHVPDSRIIGHRSGDFSRVDCAACHAVWQGLDLGRDLMRLDRPDLEDWKFLAVQGSSEIEDLTDKWADSDEMPPENALTMADKITGTKYPGLWMAGFLQRRWGPVVLGECRDGTISVIRPMLDLAVSYVNEMEETVIDSLRPQSGGPSGNCQVSKIVYPPRIQLKPLPSPYLWLPCKPHTLGKADFFRTMFVQRFLLSNE